MRLLDRFLGVSLKLPMRTICDLWRCTSRNYLGTLLRYSEGKGVKEEGDIPSCDTLSFCSS